jgi:hypothetical protein
MPLYPSLAHQLSVSRQHDAESAAARARRTASALKPRQPRSTRQRRSAAPIGGCADTARA